MDAKTALEKMREKKILVLIRTPEQRTVLVYDPAMLKARVEDDVIVIDEETIVDDNKLPCYPGIFDCDLDRRMYYFSYLKKLDSIRVYPKYRVVEILQEHDEDRLIIERSDGIRFKVAGGVVVNTVGNIALNPGITLGDLYGLIATIVSHDTDYFSMVSTDEELREKELKLSNYVALIIGFLAHEADLVELKFD